MARAIVLSALFCALSLGGADLRAGAFRFFGLRSEGNAQRVLAAMRDDFDRGDCAAVVAGSEALLKEKPFAGTRREAYRYLGQCYERQGLPDKAISLYKLARGLYPEDLFFAARLAAIYLGAGFYSTAAPLFREALAWRSDDPEANAGLGRCYAELGFLEKAKKHYSLAAILGDFRDMALLKEYARWMIRKRDWGEAEFILSMALRLDAGDAELFAARARVAGGRGDHAGAAALLDEALRRAPDTRAYALERALQLLLAGAADGALAAAGGFLEKGARDPLASLIRGMALLRRGDHAGARAALASAAADEGSFTARFAEALMAGQKGEVR